jgi:hypothetical protein
MSLMSFFSPKVTKNVSTVSKTKQEKTTSEHTSSSETTTSTTKNKESNIIADNTNSSASVTPGTAVVAAHVYPSSLVASKHVDTSSTNTNEDAKDASGDVYSGVKVSSTNFSASNSNTSPFIELQPPSNSAKHNKLIFGNGTRVSLPIPDVPVDQESNEEKATRRRLAVEMAVAPISSSAKSNSSLPSVSSPVDTEITKVASPISIISPYCMPPITRSDISPPLFNKMKNTFYEYVEHALIEIFGRFDNDGDGVLSHNEFANIYKVTNGEDIPLSQFLLVRGILGESDKDSNTVTASGDPAITQKIYHELYLSTYRDSGDDCDNNTDIGDKECWNDLQSLGYEPVYDAPKKSKSIRKNSCNNIKIHRL